MSASGDWDGVRKDCRKIFRIFVKKIPHTCKKNADKLYGQDRMAVIPVKNEQKGADKMS